MKSRKPPLSPGITALLFLSAVLPLPSMGAEGLRTLPATAESIALLGGRFTIVDDPSVGHINPANLAFQDSRRAMITYQPWRGETIYRGPAGRSDEMIRNWKHLGSVHAVVPLKEGVSAGFSLTAPYGTSISWPRQGAFRYINPFDAVLQTFSLSPSLGWKFNDCIAFGAGLDIQYSRLMMEQLYPWALALRAPAPDGLATFEADGWGLGGYFGMTITPAPGHKLALVGRLPIEIEYDGGFDVTRIPAPVAGVFGPSTPFMTDITFPGSIGVGYGWEVSSCLRLAAEAEWIQNSSHDDLYLRVGPNQPLLPSSRLAIDWDDSFSVGGALEYDLTERLSWRFGYQFSKSPIPDRTFVPFVPANDRHMFSIGLAYECECHEIGFTYTRVAMEDRSVGGNQQPGLNGHYDFGWDILSLSYGFKF